MKEEIVTVIVQEMMPLLDSRQLAALKEAVRARLCGYDIRKKETALNWQSCYSQPENLLLRSLNHYLAKKI